MYKIEGKKNTNKKKIYLYILYIYIYENQRNKIIAKILKHKFKRVY